MRTNIVDIVKKEGQSVELFGWVHARRDHGKLVFIDLRDRSGLVQVVFGPKVAGACDLRLEYVVKVTGVVQKRPPNMVNDKVPTGFYEISATEVEILNASEPLPFPVDTDGSEINEEIRLKYRYLDLRRERLQRNIKFRSDFIDRVRQFFLPKDFWKSKLRIFPRRLPRVRVILLFHRVCNRANFLLCLNLLNNISSC